MELVSERSGKWDNCSEWAATLLLSWGYIYRGILFAARVLWVGLIYLNWVSSVPNLITCNGTWDVPPGGKVTLPAPLHHSKGSEWLTWLLGMVGRFSIPGIAAPQADADRVKRQHFPAWPLARSSLCETKIPPRAEHEILHTYRAVSKPPSLKIAACCLIQCG